MVKKPRDKDEDKGPLTVPSPIDVDTLNAYGLMITGLKSMFQPLGQRSTLVLVPEGYDESFPHTKLVRFRERRLHGGVSELYVPFEKLVQVSLLKVAHSGSKIYYLASHGGREIIVNERMCAPITAKMIGPFKSKTK